MDQFIRNTIEEFTASYKSCGEIGWKNPLIAYAAADDPLFVRLKEIVSPSHALPQDFLPEARTVITYFLPFIDKVVDSNKKGRHSSRTWAVAYIETNRLIGALNRHLQGELIKKGYKVVFAPATHNFDEETLLSDWSHRSVAYIAGLGTFGLNHMLITENGCCGRIGSLVTDLELPPTPRYSVELCLYRADGSCGRCIKNCVNDALKENLLNKYKCYELCLASADRLSDLESIADVCGKCLVGVPCSTSAPNKDLTNEFDDPSAD